MKAKGDLSVMENRFSRTELLIGSEALEKLSAARVAVFGIGGVGGYAVEALARSGVGALDLIDKDTVSISNINRQIIALSSTVGLTKVQAAAERVKDINPNIKLKLYNVFYSPETEEMFDFSQYDYIIDAVDTVKAKLSIVCRACDVGVPVISSMGAGNKMDPSRFEVSDIYKTSVCPLARVMRKELKSRGIKNLKVVYSKEEPTVPKTKQTDPESHKIIPASIAFVPSVAGLIAAGEVIKDLIKN